MRKALVLIVALFLCIFVGGVTLSPLLDSYERSLVSVSPEVATTTAREFLIHTVKAVRDYHFSKPVLQTNHFFIPQPTWRILCTYISNDVGYVVELHIDATNAKVVDAEWMIP